MSNRETSILNQLASNHKENMAYSRFFNNDSVSNAALIKSYQGKVKGLSYDKHILCIQDTAEINYQKHRNFFRVEDEDLGPVGNNIDIGFFIHPVLAVDSSNLFPLGFTYIHCWNRSFEKLDKERRDYKKLAINEKESYRWLVSGQESKDLLDGQARHITIIGDREADIYDEFIVFNKKQIDLLVRSQENRLLYGEKQKLYEYLSSQPLSGTYKIKVLGYALKTY